MKIKYKMPVKAIRKTEFKGTAFSAKEINKKEKYIFKRSVLTRYSFYKKLPINSSANSFFFHTFVQLLYTRF